MAYTKVVLISIITEAQKPIHTTSNNYATAQQQHKVKLQTTLQYKRNDVK
jgi:hypothetical protein